MSKIIKVFRVRYYLRCTWNHTTTFFLPTWFYKGRTWLLSHYFAKESIRYLMQSWIKKIQYRALGNELMTCQKQHLQGTMRLLMLFFGWVMLNCWLTIIFSRQSAAEWDCALQFIFHVLSDLIYKNSLYWFCQNDDGT